MNRRNRPYGFAIFASLLLSACEPATTPFDSRPFDASMPSVPMSGDPVITDAWAAWYPGRVHARIKHDGERGALRLQLSDGRPLRSLDPSSGGLPPERPVSAMEPQGHDATVASARRPDVVEVVDAAGQVQATIPVEDPEVLALGATCDHGTGRTRCPLGAFCALPHPTCPDGETVCPSPDGVCTAFDAQATATANGLVVEILGEVPQQYGVFAGHGAPTEWLGAERVDGRLLYRGGPTAAERIDLYQHFIPVLQDLAVDPPTEEADGAACDPLGVHALCTMGSVCGGGVCAPAAPPEIEGLQIFSVAGAIAVSLSASDPNHDIVEVELAAGDLLVTRFPVPTGAYERISSSHFVQEGERFEVFGSSQPFQDPVPLPGETVCAQVKDSTGLVAEQCAVVNADPPRTVVEPDERCDLLGLIQVCGDDTWCSATEGDARLLCRRPQACTDLREPPPALLLDTPMLAEDGVLGGTNSIEPCDTRYTTFGYHYTFTAPATGRYRIDSNAEDETFAVRASCGLLHTLLACGEVDFVEVDLDEGQEVTVVFWSPEARSLAGPSLVDVVVTRL